MFDFFKPSAPQKTPAPAPAPEATPSAPTPAVPEASKSALDHFNDLLNNKNAPTNPAEAPKFALDPSKVSEVTSKMSFTDNLPREMLEGVDPRMVSLLNAVGQQAYAQALNTIPSLTDAHLEQRSQYESQNVQKGVRSEMTREAISSISQDSHPVVKQYLNDIARQIQSSNPDASPAQIAKQAHEVLLEIGKMVNPSAPSVEEKKKASEIDYVQWLSS